MSLGTKRLVEVALYGAGEGRRFTLDSPILSDVWAQYFEKPNRRFSLLLEPWLDTAAFLVAESLKIGEVNQQLAAISYNRTVVVADLTLEELVSTVLPLTGWYREILTEPDRRPSAFTAPILPFPEQMWQDLPVDGERSSHPGDERYAHPRFLSVIRIAGLIFAMAADPDQDGEIRQNILQNLGDIASGDQQKIGPARNYIARVALHGWHTTELYPPISTDKIVYSIRRNRPAKLAVQKSVRTVKGDAASNLFSIDCSALTWAVIDSGIDATHEAFQDRAVSWKALNQDDNDNLVGQGLTEDGRATTVALAHSRVRETYDFSHLRELLTSEDWDGLPAHVRSARGPASKELSPNDTQSLREELLLRIQRSRLVDWELLRPFLRVGHDHCYLKPSDAHGTHVAGILGCHWHRDDEPMLGMCPDINIIDIRVVREDGSSDEFVIMSALQFVRHLNANSDRIAVHGVNMSLSLEHDASVYACGRTPICEEAERTVASGVVVVAAAGNHGYRRVLSDASEPFDQYCPVSITDPGNAENVITVGSTHRLEPHTYGISYFSSRGPTGDGRIKPDLVAPGEKIYAPAPNNEAMRLDGTSMAAPHVSGAAAMLMARHVELIGQPQRIKQILCSTATDLGREPYFQGKGLVDILRAIQSV